MTTADRIRQYALAFIISPARQRRAKTVTFSSTDIHKGIGLKHSFPLVCSSIDADKFLDYANVILASRTGPKQSTTVRWTFDLGK